MLKKYRLLFYFVAACMIYSCTSRQKDPSPSGNKSGNAEEEMLNADIAFSAMSRQVGMKKAFIEYMSSDGVLLRPHHLPIIGADAIDFLSQLSDSSYTLTWEPSGADISRSGDLGFTYGIYELKLKDTVYQGTYVSIWKKQPDGSWKFVLDSGNEGIHPANTAVNY